LFVHSFWRSKRCSPAPEEKTTSTSPGADAYAEFHSTIDEYVRQEYAWAKDAYRIEFQRRDGDVLVFWVIHSDDEKLVAYRTGGKSIEVVESSEPRVTKKFHFQ